MTNPVGDQGVGEPDDLIDNPDFDQILLSGNRVGRKVPNMVVGNLDESQILAMAPAMICDRVHWATIDEDKAFDAGQLIRSLPMEAYSRRWSDEQHRIWVPAGMGYPAREAIKEWCLGNQIDPINMRVECGVPFRDVDSIPGTLFQELILTLVDWLYPRCYSIRRRIMLDLELIEPDDLRPMMYLFVSDHMDRYDPGRIGKNGTLNCASFMLGKIRKWPQDASRTAYGRNVIDDRMLLNRAVDESMATKSRRPTEGELATGMKTTVADLRRREQAVSELASLRNHGSIVSGSSFDDSGAVDVASADSLDQDSTAFDTDAQLTRSVMNAVNRSGKRSGESQLDPLGFAALYLSFWGELSRQDLATELQVLPKTATAAVRRVVGHIGASGDLSES